MPLVSISILLLLIGYVVLMSRPFLVLRASAELNAKFLVTCVDILIILCLAGAVMLSLWS